MLSILREVEELGAQLIVAGDRLRVSAPQPLPDHLVQELRRHKPELLSFVCAASNEAGSRSVNAGALGAAARDEWDPETARLIEWFLGTAPPDRPFQLQQAVTVAVPIWYWECLKGDVAAGPRRARGRMRTAVTN